MRMPRLSIRSLGELFTPLLLVSLTTGCGGEQGDDDTVTGETPEVEDLTSCSAQEGLSLEPFGLVGSDQMPQGSFEDEAVRGFFTNADYFPVAPGENSYLCPRADLQTWPAEPIEGGHCVGTEFESQYALRIRAFAIDQWASLGTKWHTPHTTSVPIDASEWDGIAFWARRGCSPSQVPESFIGPYCDELPDSAPPDDSSCAEDSAAAAEDPSDDQVFTGRTVFVSIMEWQTEGWTNGDPPEVVHCDSNTAVDALKCDAFGIGIGLDNEWRYYKLPFSAMRQRGYGVYAECAYLRELWGVNFSFSPGDWDVWLDDISLFREDDEPEERPECDAVPPEEE